MFFSKDEKVLKLMKLTAPDGTILKALPDSKKKNEIGWGLNHSIFLYILNVENMGNMKLDCTKLKLKNCICYML